MQHFKIINGDVTEVLKTLPDNFFDAVLSDPPYGISFMGKAWDRGVPSSSTYKELARVLKPGAFGLHFGGTRMWHRLAISLEDAGFELRDTVLWLYGSGFPKSHNISKALDKVAGAEREVVGERKQWANGEGTNGGSFNNSANQVELLTVPATEAAKTWDGYGTALKPAWEPALLVQKPLDKTFANNALAWGSGGLNIDGCRVGCEIVSVHNAPAGSFAGGELGRGSDTTSYSYNTGRFPANLILDEEAGEALDAQSGTRPGGPSRFFYCAKVPTKERNAGLGDGFEIKSAPYESYRENAQDTKGIDTPFAGAARAGGSKNSHPTLKPLALTEYLAKLLLVPDRKPTRDIYGNEVKKPRRILVPFSGAGSEMIGCLKAGWDEVWGIEIDEEYVMIAKARIAFHTQAAPLF